MFKHNCTVVFTGTSSIVFQAFINIYIHLTAMYRLSEFCGTYHNKWHCLKYPVHIHLNMNIQTHHQGYEKSYL